MHIPLESAAHEAIRFFEESDGVLLCTNSLYEHGCTESWRKWFGAKPVLNVGALSPPASAAEILKEKETPVGGAVEKFLDDMLDKHGPNSVVYVSLIRLMIKRQNNDVFLEISFGTIFWPAEPEKMWAVIDELLEEGVPLVRRFSLLPLLLFLNFV